MFHDWEARWCGTKVGKKQIRINCIFIQNTSMVTYQIQIPESNRDAFLDILKSLKRLGVVTSFQVSDSWVQPGKPLDEEELLAMLQISEKQATEGLIIPA